MEIPPPHRQNIQVRGQAPEFCKLKMKSIGSFAGGGGSIDQIKAAFYQLARPVEVEVNSEDLIYSQPDVLSQSTPPVATPPELIPLSSEEKASAIAKIKAAGEVGLTIGNTGMHFVWKEKCGVGFGQKRPRISDQLCVKRVGTNQTYYEPLCTFEGKSH